MEITQLSVLTEDDFPTDVNMWVEECVEEFYDKTKHMMTTEEKDLLTSALKYRIKNRSKDYEGSVFDKVMGLYKIEAAGDVFYIELSNDPVHILSRTTGRSGYSCEQISQHYWKGPFQDLGFRNATAYFYNKDMKWLGRLNTRWCLNDSGEIDIGVDPNIYPMMGGWVTGNLIRGLESGEKKRDDKLLHNTIWTLLARKGFLYYEKAHTPYSYVGHSDTTISGGVQLPFKGLKHHGY